MTHNGSTGVERTGGAERTYYKRVKWTYEEKKYIYFNPIYIRKYMNYKAIYGLLCKCLENDTIIQKALAEANIFEEQPRFDPLLARILTTELIFKNGELKGDCRPVQTILQYKTKILSIANSSLLLKDPSEKKQGLIPRYVRINTLMSSSERVHAQLQQDGWQLKKYNSDSLSYKDYLKLIKNLDGNSYVEDYHLPDLLVFPSNTPFWESSLLKTNAIVLQDKASCLPPFLSRIKPGCYAIDACAAPGNKTSYIAALLKNQGTVYAIEKDGKRYNTLNQMITSRGATCVKTQLNDFTKLDPQKYKKVTHIFLDPSCSSTGMNIHTDEVSSERLVSLATFQLNLLNHALSFPNVQMVIYSTCSVHTQENEEVVQRALQNNQHIFDLEDLSQSISDWTNFGYDDNFSLGNRCLRTISEEDLCHGFFVAKFVRNESADEELSCKKEKKRKKNKDNIKNEITENRFESMHDDNDFITESNSSFNNDRCESVSHEENKSTKKKNKKKSELSLEKKSIEIKNNNFDQDISHSFKKTKKRTHLNDVCEDELNKNILYSRKCDDVPKKKKKKKREDNL
ncbi:unnamed protein product, partial [Meganyctiphanes norvegica]